MHRKDNCTRREKQVESTYEPLDTPQNVKKCVEFSYTHILLLYVLCGHAYLHIVVIYYLKQITCHKFIHLHSFFLVTYRN